MLRLLGGILLAAATLAAQERHFDRACSAIYPAVVQSMTAQGFEVKVSDAAGGVLTMNYIGEPMVMKVMYKHASAFTAKYVVDGEKLRNQVRGLTFTGATFGFTSAGEGCDVRLAVALSTIDSKLNRYRAPGAAPLSWTRVYKPVASNGTAERELLEGVR